MTGPPSASPPAEGRSPLRIGIVGAGRTRQGLGPYLARACEAAGGVVTGVAGRDVAGAERAATALAALLGHPVAAAATAEALARAVDLLVVAAPVPGHLAGLDAALAAGVACLCEKPLVAAADCAAGLQRIAAFRARGLLLVENCQWPFVLPALFALCPELRGAPVREVVMRLSPVGSGPSMAEDSLSHVLSLVQGLVDLPDDCRPERVHQSDASASATGNTVSFRLPAGAGPVDVTLHLQQCQEQPRPAWIAVNGRRIDRRIGVGYSISFVAGGGREVAVRDPLDLLVEDFVAAALRRDRVADAAAAARVATRLSVFARVLMALRPA